MCALPVDQEAMAMMQICVKKRGVRAVGGLRGNARRPRFLVAGGPLGPRPGAGSSRSGGLGFAIIYVFLQVHRGPAD